MSTIRKCPECEVAFECCNTERGCWCEELPNLIPLTENAECLCKNCLEKKIDGVMRDKR
ncbi:MAG TPA: hypothetical protein VL651_04730 [Bacteroidia bacterium]|nr:hypothetical protein [Bacteroidia bacterium]